jgi:hypothetical protein
MKVMQDYGQLRATPKELHLNREVAVRAVERKVMLD